MVRRKRVLPEASYVDTPNGIFTAAGTWFSATRAIVEEYAGEVLEHESLDRLLGRAEIWLRSPETLTLWFFPIALLIADLLPASLGALTFYVGWKSLGPNVVSRSLEKVFELLDLVWLQGVYYVLILSYAATLEQFAIVWTGLAGFILLRWGIVSRVTRPIVHTVTASLFQLAVPDHVLRSFIIRAAIKHRVAVPHVERMEKRILEIWSRRTQKG